MTALDLSAATRVLSVPMQPFSELTFGEQTFSAYDPHPVRTVGGLPGIPRRSGAPGVSSLSSDVSIAASLYGATFVAFRGSFDENSSYSNPNAPMCYYTSSIYTDRLSSAYVHDQYVPLTVDPLNTPHTVDGITVYAFVNNPTEAFVANSLDGVLGSIASIEYAPGSNSTYLNTFYGESELDIMGMWNFDDVEVSSQDALDTMAAIIDHILAGPQLIDPDPGAVPVVGPAYQSKIVQAILGPARSSEIPDVLWPGWLDAGGRLVEMTGLSVTHDAWGPVEGGVANIEVIEGGMMPASSISRFALFDAEENGAVVLASVPVEFVETVPAGEPVFASPGAIKFLYGAETVVP